MRLVTLLISIVISQSCFCQTNFDKTYDLGNGNSDGIHSIFQFNNSIISAGYSYNPYRDIVLFKTDNYGNAIDTLHYSLDSTHLITYKAQMVGATIVVVGATHREDTLMGWNPFIARFNTSFDLLSYWELDTTAHIAIYDFIIDDNDNVIITGVIKPNYTSTISTNIFTVKLDQLNNIQWIENYGSIGFPESPVDIVELPNGDIVIGGRKNNPAYWHTYDYVLLKYSSAGAVKSFFQMQVANKDEYLMNVRYLDDKFFIAGVYEDSTIGNNQLHNLHFCVLDSVYNYVEDIRFDQLYSDYYRLWNVSSVYERNDFIYWTGAENGTGFIQKLDKSGTVKWKRLFGEIGESYTAISDMKINVNGSIVAGGTRSNYAFTSGEADSRIMFLDQFGTVSVEPKKNETFENFRFHCYPNPFGDNLSIKVFSSNDLNNILTLTTISGSLIFSQMLGNSEVFTIDLSKINSGVYILNVENDNKRYSQHVIKY